MSLLSFEETGEGCSTLPSGGWTDLEAYTELPSELKPESCWSNEAQELNMLQVQCLSDLWLFSMQSSVFQELLFQKKKKKSHLILILQLYYARCYRTYSSCGNPLVNSIGNYHLRQRSSSRMSHQLRPLQWWLYGTREAAWKSMNPRGQRKQNKNKTLGSKFNYLQDRNMDKSLNSCELQLLQP